MPLMIEDAQHLSNNDLVRGVVEEIIDFDNLFSVLPFVKTEGKSYVYNREGTLATATWIVPNASVIPEDATTFQEVTVTLRILIGDVDVDNFLNSTMSDTNSQLAVQIAHKAKAIARKFSDALINGDASKSYNLSDFGGTGTATNVEFDGLDRLTVPAMTLSAGTNGGALTFELLDQLIDKVKLGPDAFVFGRRTIRDYKRLLRSVSRVSPEYIRLSNGKDVLGYAGVPILLNDFVREDLTVGTSVDCSTVFAARMNEVDGVHGLYGGDNMGFSIQNIGQLQTKDAQRTRVRWYCAVALKGTKSLGKIVGIRSI
ncbi:major capsid protein [Azospirillum sp. Sh1]|uniref:major capsid protein n=1 Tax=Azospirillum sp. Sh1 TaxID=2607285 RepID=UPI0011EEB43C|nr:phage major capsid protein [Azospirillum sp. Sh1]KAA0573491.1 phage major capsid protein [Azospirillum sp. Sh1]